MSIYSNYAVPPPLPFSVGTAVPPPFPSSPLSSVNISEPPPFPASAALGGLAEPQLAFMSQIRSGGASLVPLARVNLIPQISPQPPRFTSVEIAILVRCYREVGGKMVAYLSSDPVVNMIDVLGYSIRDLMVLDPMIHEIYLAGISDNSTSSSSN